MAYMQPPGLAAQAQRAGDGPVTGAGSAGVLSCLALRWLAQSWLALRPVTGSEIPAIGTMWERCSLATRIARFHAPVRDIPASYLEAILSDPSANVVAVREPAGDVVALASLIASPGGGTAELGVLVEDAWQRRGIGSRLVAHLISGAPARGITTLTASVLAGNAGVADLLRRVPGRFSITGDGEVLTVRVRLGARAPAGPMPSLRPAPVRPEFMPNEPW